MPATIFRGRRAAAVENEHLRVTVLQEGGHIAELFDKLTGVSPLWIPPWPSIEPSSFDPKYSKYGLDSEAKLLSGIMGHNLCLDIFGGPSAEEAALGLTVHGEGSVAPYEISETGTTLSLKAHLPLAQLHFERSIELRSRSLKIREAVENLAAWDRPIAWTQHVSLGPPFLEKRTSQLHASVTRSKVHEPNFGADMYLKRGAEFDWPMPRFGAANTRRAIEAAEAAWPAWRAKTGKERSQILRRWFDLCMQNQDDLATILTLEQGKPFAEARGEIAYGSGFIEWFAEEAKRVYGDVIPGHSRDRRIVVIKQPVGVVAAITPWNFPNAMITRKAGAALAAGCTIVVKPAALTPYSALALAELAEQAGVPKGVLNIITGPSGVVGGELTSNPVVRKLSFTGSTEVGRILLEQCAGTIKKVSMELGGNAPFIIFADADLEKAVSGVMISKFRNGGQTCVCANRIFVEDSIYEVFARKLEAAVRALVVGDGLTAGTTIGPLIDERAVEKVEEHIADAVEHGAKISWGGKRHSLGGNFFEPTILLDVPKGTKLMNEETFGPVAPLTRFSSEQEVIAMSNDTEFGLASYFYTRDIGRVWRVAEALEYGIVGINEGLISTEVAPFGGVKQSGLGREGSKYGVEEYVEVKYLCMGGI